MPQLQRAAAGQFSFLGFLVICREGRQAKVTVLALNISRRVSQAAWLPNRSITIAGGRLSPGGIKAINTQTMAALIAYGLREQGAQSHCDIGRGTEYLARWLDPELPLQDRTHRGRHARTD